MPYQTPVYKALSRLPIVRDVFYATDQYMALSNGSNLTVDAYSNGVFIREAGRTIRVHKKHIPSLIEALQLAKELD